jgi:hypothetical protein
MYAVQSSDVYSICTAAAYEQQLCSQVMYIAYAVHCSDICVCMYYVCVLCSVAHDLNSLPTRATLYRTHERAYTCVAQRSTQRVQLIHISARALNLL